MSRFPSFPFFGHRTMAQVMADERLSARPAPIVLSADLAKVLFGWPRLPAHQRKRSSPICRESASDRWSCVR